MSGTRWTDDVVAELMAALEPFAQDAALFDPGGRYEMFDGDSGCVVCVKHLRAARAALTRARGPS